MDIITSTTAKILMYNVFDEKALNFNIKPLDVNLINNLSLNNFSIITDDLIKRNFTFNNNNNNNNNISGLSTSALSDFDTGKKDYVIIDILLKLFRPVLFICLCVFLKIVFFSTKHTFSYLGLILTVVTEYLQIKINEGKENSINNLFEILPVYLFFCLYLAYTIQNTYHFLKKYSVNSISYNINNTPPYNTYSIRNKKYYKYSRLDSYSLLQKIIILSFDILLCVSLILFIYTFSLCIRASSATKLQINQTNSKDLSEWQDENTQIKLFALIAAVLFIIGNIYKIGDVLTNLLFYSIEKELFPAPIKKFYLRILFKTKSNGLRLISSLESDPYEESEFDPMVNDDNLLYLSNGA